MSFEFATVTVAFITEVDTLKGLSTDSELCVEDITALGTPVSSLAVHVSDDGRATVAVALEVSFGERLMLMMTSVLVVVCVVLVAANEDGNNDVVVVVVDDSIEESGMVLKAFSICVHFHSIRIQCTGVCYRAGSMCRLTLF